jgi:sulfoxide reductase heme-binding subunit YedZ
MTSSPAASPRTAKAGLRSAAAMRRVVTTLLLHRAAKPLLFVLCLLPFAWLLYGAVMTTMGAELLGANPAETLIRRSGDWTLRALCLTLAITPLRQLTGLHALARFRRMFGLFTFFYGSLHFACYAWLDQGLDWPTIAHDIAKRPFILVGVSAWLAMLPLAATSFNRAIKALGAARWQALHRLVYGTALLALLHFFWMRAAKHNFTEWSVYAALMTLLLGWRVAQWLRRRQAAARVPAAPARRRIQPSAQPPKAPSTTTITGETRA